MSTRLNINNYINLDNFPKKSGFGMNSKRNVVDWINSEGCIAQFKYATFYGEMKVIKYHKKELKLEVEYNNKTYKISTDAFINCQFKNIFGVINLKYKYDINTILNVSTGKLQIINHIRRITDNKKQYQCKCLECNSEFPKLENLLENGSGCPVCAGHEAGLGISDMWTTAPEIASLLLDKDDGYKYTKRSNKKLNWVCPICGEIIYNKTPSNVYIRGLTCPVCGKTKSYPNRLMYSLLRYLNADFKDEKSFKWSNNKKYDFYLLKSNAIIEMHGQQHYDKDMFNSTCESIHLNDVYKEEMANENNILDYIVIDSRCSTLEWIKNNIINSNLSKIFDLSKVDWLEVDRIAQINKLKDACRLWDEGIHDMKVIAKCIGYHPSGVSLFLRKGYQLGITTYSPELSRKLGGITQATTTYNKYSTPFMCVETGQIFGSVTICSNNSISIFGRKLETTVISKTLSCKIKNLNSKKEGARPIHFQYITRSEFNTIKSQSPELAFGDFFISTEQPTNNIQLQQKGA